MGKKLDALICRDTALEMLADLLEDAGLGADAMFGPDWEPSYWHIRISGLDLNGNDTPYNHLKNMVQYAFRHKQRPECLRFERQSGFKLTENPNLHKLLDADGRPRRTRRHWRNHDRKGWLADHAAIRAGELQVRTVLTHGMDRFARRLSTGTMWLETLQGLTIKVAETKRLTQPPRLLTEDGLFKRYVDALAAAQHYSDDVSEKIREEFDAKAGRGEATYAVGNCFGHAPLWSDELDPVRVNEQGLCYQAGGRIDRAEAELLRFALRVLLETGSQGTTVKRVNEAVDEEGRPRFRTRRGNLFTIRTLCKNNLASPRMIGFQTLGDWMPSRDEDAELAWPGAMRYGEQRIVPCELIEPIFEQGDWWKAVDIIHGRTHAGRAYRRHPLSGFGTCGLVLSDGSVCGCNITGTTSSSGPRLRCGRRRDVVSLCDCGSPAGRCVCQGLRRAAGLLHPSMDLVMVGRVLAEATLLSYDAQRVADDATKLLAADATSDELNVILDAEEAALKAEKKRIRESHRAGLYESEREMLTEVGELDEQLASLARRRDRLKAEDERRAAAEVDPGELRRRVESSQQALVALARTVMDGYVLLPQQAGRYEERVVIRWKPGCDPGEEATQALYDELRRRRITARAVANAAMQPHAVGPEVADVMWRLYKEGDHPLAIARKLRAAGFALPSQQPAGTKGRDTADSGFISRELKRQCRLRNEDYVANRRRKYSDETRAIIFELCRDGRSFPDVCAVLAEQVRHPDGAEWSPWMVRSLYASECARRGGKPLGRRPALNSELRSLVWAKASSGMSRAELAEYLNRSRVVRPGRARWNVPAVAHILRAERKRLEAEGVLEPRAYSVDASARAAMLDMHRGGMSRAQLAAWANEQGLQRRKDAPWDITAVANALQTARKAERRAQS